MPAPVSPKILSVPSRPVTLARHVQVGAAADQVVLAETAEDEVVAVAALDVVVAVGVQRLPMFGTVVPGFAHEPTSTEIEPSPWIDVVALLAEDQVVVDAAGEAVVAPDAGRRGSRRRRRA